MSIDLHNFLRTRRSVRRFLGPAAKTGKPDPVPAPVMERILETATYAPSAHNLQPWRFVVVADASARNRLGQALTDKMRADMTAQGAPEAGIRTRMERSLRRLDEAPIVILLCRDETSVRVDEQEEITMSIQSVAAAGLQLMLAAHAEGLGSNWICWPLYAQEAAREALDLPNTWEPQAMFFLGYANDEPGDKTLKPLQDLVRFI
ncbi:MAG: nitroreductase family protein [Anaerolineales bacterium]|nr:nitroreductase family protein [Anaerolineales bacterium]